MNLRSLLNGNVTFDGSEDYQGFRFRLLNAALLTGILFTSVFVVIDVLGFNRLGAWQLGATVIDGLATAGLFLLLRGHKQRYPLVAAVFVAVNLLTFLSALVFVSNDELRVIWFFVGVVVVYVLLGVHAGIGVTIDTIVSLLIANAYLDAPFSGNAMATLVISLCVTSAISWAYTRQSISYGRAEQRQIFHARIVVGNFSGYFAKECRF